jgi:hypothetical protein
MKQRSPLALMGLALAAVTLSRRRENADTNLRVKHTGLACSITGHLDAPGIKKPEPGIGQKPDDYEAEPTFPGVREGEHDKGVMISDAGSSGITAPAMLSWFVDCAVPAHPSLSRW